MIKYYMAYEERYKKLHNEGLMWFSDIPTPELLDWIKFYNIPKEEHICEIGCGEGRDAIYLSKNGYKLTAIDVSDSAIRKCKELSIELDIDINWIVADALFLHEVPKTKYKWIYSIATLHMLVDNNDRKRFLESIYNLLEPGGKLLLVSKGDGINERMSDVSNAFDLQERNHLATGNKVIVAATSYRSMNWDNYIQELKQSGFFIEKLNNTHNHEYDECMTVYLSRK
jgi:ubiquinone/menaquinone biosynthesis C-methylase UbiE